MKNVYKNIDQLKEQIAKDKEHDYLDIYNESDNIVIMLNWEKFIIKKEKVNGIKFRYTDEGISNEFGIIFNGTILDVPIYIAASDANKLEIKIKKIL